MKINNINTYVGKTRVKFLLLMLVFGAISTSYGQSKNEVSFSLGGLFSKLDYEVLGQKNNMENGLKIGVGYFYYLSDSWSIGTGTELQYIEGSAYLSDIEDADTTTDMEGEEFEFRYRAEDFFENQYVYFLNIPLQVQYETKGITRFYAAGGFKAGFVIQSEYEAEASSLTTSGYYKQYDAELSDPKFAGFGDFGPMQTTKSKLGLKTNFIFNLETGVKFMLENDKALYMGLFVDYGLNNIRPEQDQQNLIAYNTEDPMNFINGSLLSSENNTDSTQYVEELNTLAFGLKIQYALQF
ncbi:outer membrane beta-barrel protein [Salegentibacter sp. F188]|uniref:Outer membrane beta-barrel protein n=1 Tax=Autumnicola patrickiae TaxID=3075591 RepID=A0ABU3E5G1_9FLAO|nr:outer membrane beta-barrel protein [Salegentibacter sp. F188]MDT0691138.1 outer membrane beta-barrel protein [Salegentibacter sp. F188]